ncbi:MAG: 3-dehydroquinate synthase [Candidatus Promineifilaceae bacterium]|nr:3-dehydroquinate synthase [Candidatus Promineifilaceae bacterium]
MGSIVLTGFMGTGKTTIGRRLAARTGRIFVDTDELIAHRSGMSIPALFDRHGEAAFRRQEAELARELAGQAGLVIATGGGLLLNPANAAILSENNRVLCLTAAAETLVARLTATGDRPLLEGEAPEARLRALLAERATAYARFPQIDTTARTPDEVVEGLADRLELAPADSAPTSDPERLTISHPGGTYELVIARGLLAQPHLLTEGASGAHALITDTNVGPLYGTRLPAVEAVVTIPAGEEQKRLETVRTVYDFLLTAGIDRSGAVIALGGGVIGDLAGFVAATYMRGLPLYQCPTTLLAMVDASVGGKTGVDLPQGKNLVGAFKQPAAVYADVSTLNTLPPAEFAGGMAEVVKHALLAGGRLLDMLEGEAWSFPSALRSPRLQQLIVEAVRVKRVVVEEDPYERGRRAVLNLGHTFAHAVEQVSSYQVGHGEAVAMGLVAAAELSVRLGYAEPALQERVEQLLALNYLPTRFPATLRVEALLAAMAHDKKKVAGRLRFILLRAPGQPFVASDVSEQAVRATLAALGAAQ